MQVLLPSEHIKIQPIKVTNKPKVKHNNHAKATRNEGVKVDHDKPEEKSKEAEKLGKSHFVEPPTELQPTKKSMEAEDLKEKLTTLPNQVKEANQNNAIFTEVCRYLPNSKDHNRPNVYLCGSKAANGLLFKNNKL